MSLGDYKATRTDVLRGILTNPDVHKVLAEFPHELRILDDTAAKLVHEGKAIWYPNMNTITLLPPHAMATKEDLEIKTVPKSPVAASAAVATGGKAVRAEPAPTPKSKPASLPSVAVAPAQKSKTASPLSLETLSESEDEEEGGAAAAVSIPTPRQTFKPVKSAAKGSAAASLAAPARLSPAIGKSKSTDMTWRGLDIGQCLFRKMVTGYAKRFTIAGKP